MNEANAVYLEGTVRADPLEGGAWTRWTPRGRGQVRFWLAVSRELAGEGCDMLLCAIEPREAAEIDRLQRELRDGRAVRLQACARMVARDAMPREESPGVIFIAEGCSLDGGPPNSAHRIGMAPRKRAHGKAAAAADDLAAELDLELEGATR